MLHIMNHSIWLKAGQSTPTPVLNTSRWECFIRGLESSDSNVSALMELYRGLHDMLRGKHTYYFSLLNIEVTQLQIKFYQCCKTGLILQ